MGFPKIALPPGTIERMDLLLEHDADLFKSYAIRAEIAARHAHRMRQFAKKAFGDEVPLSAKSGDKIPYKLMG